jgi:hypothetical protein
MNIILVVLDVNQRESNVVRLLVKKPEQNLDKLKHDTKKVHF